MPETLNRRQFMDRAAVGAAGLTVASQFAAAQEAPSERIVVGVMGLSRGLALATGFVSQPNVEVRYVCDTDSNRAAQGAAVVEKAGAPKPKIIGDFRKILEDKEVDALYIQLRDAKPADTADVEEGVTIDLDAKGHIVGIEILDEEGFVTESTRPPLAFTDEWANDVLVGPTGTPILAGAVRMGFPAIVVPP